MVCVQKWPFFQVFFLGNIDQENVFYDILEAKMPFHAIKTRSSKNETIDIFLKGLTNGFCKKNGHFPNFVFLGNIDQENVFYDILEQKNAFLCYKNKKIKKSKN